MTPSRHVRTRGQPASAQSPTSSSHRVKREHSVSSVGWNSDDNDVPNDFVAPHVLINESDDRYHPADNGDGNGTDEDQDPVPDDDGRVSYDGFTVRQGLPKSSLHIHTVESLYDLLETPSLLELSPSYQRDVVWSDRTQSLLIDSIMTGFYVPPIIFCERSEHLNGRRIASRVCVDGKQRLSAIRRFIQGEIKCRDDEGKLYDFRRLPLAAKRRFWSRPLYVVQYKAMDIDREHDLFERVQQGDPLSLAEKLQAKQGPWQDYTRYIMEHYPLTMELNHNRRAAGFDRIISSLMQLCAQIAETAQPNTTPTFKGGLSCVTRMVDARTFHCTAGLKVRANRIFDCLERLVTIDDNGCHHSDLDCSLATPGLPKKSALSPVEFIAFVCVIDKYMTDTRTPRMIDIDLRRLISRMRINVRTAYSGQLRRNQRVWEALWEPVLQNDRDRAGLLTEREVIDISDTDGETEVGPVIASVPDHVAMDVSRSPHGRIRQMNAIHDEHRSHETGVTTETNGSQDQIVSPGAGMRDNASSAIKREPLASSVWDQNQPSSDSEWQPDSDTEAQAIHRRSSRHARTDMSAQRIPRANAQIKTEQVPEPDVPFSSLSHNKRPRVWDPDTRTWEEQLDTGARHNVYEDPAGEGQEGPMSKRRKVGE